jgi:hypothetical protein
MIHHTFKKLHQDLYVIHVQVHYIGEDLQVYQHIIARDVQELEKFIIPNNYKYPLHSLALVMLLKVLCKQETFV